MLPREKLRILDANFNRTGEGLRVLEDIARFALGDAALTACLREMRHRVLDTGPELQLALIEARDSVHDVGALTPEHQGRDLGAAVIANARRIQEALRVIDEMARDGDPDSSKYKEARFALYDLEKTLLGRLARRDKTDRLAGVYVIIDSAALKGRPPVAAAADAIAGGARVIQLRHKLSAKRDMLPVALQLKELCAARNVLFIVNDYLDLALASKADGLHLGQDDLPAEVARGLIPIDMLLGVSARTVEQAKAAESAGADYIAVGSMFPTSSKETAVVVGLERMREVRKAVSVKVVGIGGINRENAAEVIAAGASAVAVIGAVLGASDIAAATREIEERVRT